MSGATTPPPVGVWFWCTTHREPHRNDEHGEGGCIASGDHEPAPVLARLDAARDEYRSAYSDAEALVWSTIATARRWGRGAGIQAARSAERRAESTQVAPSAGSAPAYR